MRTHWKKRVALIGYGAITEEIVSCLSKCNGLDELAAVLVKPSQREACVLRSGSRFPVVATLQDMLNECPEIVVECAGHGALRDYGSAILDHGVDLLIASAGALADRELAQTWFDAACTSSTSIWIPSGAVAGIDGLIAARTSGLDHVIYTSAKGPNAWVNTPAENILAASGLARRVVLFEGSAREAARSYPRNANVAATVAMAGLGMDRTRVRLVCDPHTAAPLGIIEAAGEFGTFRFEILARASVSNPKTSLLTAHSLIAAWHERVCFRAKAGLALGESKLGKHETICAN